MSDPLAKIKKKIQDEIDQLSHELSVELPKEIAVARAHGDLSENAEYKFAKERQGYVNAKISQLKKRMGDLGMLNLSNIPKDRAGYGSRLIVLDTQRDVKIEYKLVSTEEADVEKGLISTTASNHFAVAGVLVSKTCRLPVRDYVLGSRPRAWGSNFSRLFAFGHGCAAGVAQSRRFFRLDSR